MEPVSNKTRWVSVYDQYGEPSEELVGSRDGLLHLRSQIDNALEKGIAETSSDVDFDFQRIKVQDSHPRDEAKTIKDAVFKYGFLSMLVIALLFIGIGIYHVVEKFIR